MSQQYQQSPQTVQSGTDQSTGIRPSSGTSTANYQQTTQPPQTQMGQQSQGLQFPTESHLPADVREPLVQRLNQVLADATILMTHAKFAHWNVKGMAFYGLHELFDDIAGMFEDHVDLVAERVTALGGQAMGTAGMAVSNCGIPHMPHNVVQGADYVDVLAERLAVHDANLYDAIETANQYEDLDTADMLNEISREVSQALWFLEAHLHTQPISASGQGQQQGQFQQGRSPSQMRQQQTVQSQQSAQQPARQQQARQ